MPAAIAIPLSQIEITYTYDYPSIPLMTDRAELIHQLFEAFRPWKPDIDDLLVVNEGKVSEQGITIKAASERASFFVGVAYCRFTKNGVNWAEAAKIEEMVNAVLSTFHRLAPVKLAGQKVTLSMHIQPEGVSVGEILRKTIVAEKLRNFGGEEMLVSVAILRWRGFGLTIDRSAAIANGIYIQIEREHGPEATFADFKTALAGDQERLFALLDVQEAKN